MKGMFGVAVIGLALALSAGCSDRTEQRAREAARESGEAAEKTGEALESAAKDAVQNTREAGAVAGAATEDAAEKVGAAMETLDVKTALLADSRVDASRIDVDTNHETRVVTLRGSVPDAGQKAIAEGIAAANAKGHRIDNQLRVGG
jgi:osmotically-inducible protein OsmY